MTLTEKAKAALEAAGVDAYDPGEKNGPCKGPYAVVYDGGDEPVNPYQGYRIVDVLCMAPVGRRDLLAKLRGDAQSAILAGVPALKFRGNPQPESVDDAFKAHTITLEFQALCAL